MSYVDRGIELARKLAYTSDCPNFKIGAALMKANRVVATGRNWFKKSHPRSQTIWNGIHAEFDCLHGVNLAKTKNCTLFVVRITNGGEDAMARPCVMCQQVILKSAVRVVYYTNQDGNVVRERMGDDH